MESNLSLKPRLGQRRSGLDRRMCSDRRGQYPPAYDDMVRYEQRSGEDRRQRIRRKHRDRRTVH